FGASALAKAEVGRAALGADGVRELAVDVAAARGRPLDEAAARELLELDAAPGVELGLALARGRLLGDQPGDVLDVALRVGPAPGLDLLEQLLRALEVAAQRQLSRLLALVETVRRLVATLARARAGRDGRHETHRPSRQH